MTRRLAGRRCVVIDVAGMDARHAPSPLGEAEAALDDYADALAATRREGLTLGLPLDTVERIFALGFALEQVRHNFHDLERCVGEAARRK